MSIVEQSLRRAVRRHVYEREALLLVAQDPDGLDELAEWNHQQFTMPE